jgi:hypothetical protein
MTFFFLSPRSFLHLWRRPLYSSVVSVLVTCSVLRFSADTAGLLVSYGIPFHLWYCNVPWVAGWISYICGRYKRALSYLLLHRRIPRNLHTHYSCLTARLSCWLYHHHAVGSLFITTHSVPPVRT